MALSNWQQEKLDAFTAPLDPHKYQIATAESHGWNTWKVLDMYDNACFFFRGKHIVTQPKGTNDFKIHVHAHEVYTSLGSALEQCTSYGLTTYSDHLKFSFYARSSRAIVGARRRRIPIRYGMTLTEHQGEWQDKRDIYPTIPHNEPCGKKGTHNFITWFAFKGQSWTECNKCGMNLHRKNPTADHIRLHHQGWRMRNDLRDGKHHRSFRDRLPGTEIHYNHETDIFMKVSDRLDYYKKNISRHVKDSDVMTYSTYGVFDQPALDNEPSYADFVKLAKEMRP